MFFKLFPKIEKEYKTFIEKKDRILHEREDVLMMINEIDSKKKELFMKTYEIIDHGKDSGEFSRRQETRDTVLYLQAVHDGNMMIWYRSGIDPEIGRRLAKATLAGFLKTAKD